jgi:hypothetical protein
MDDPQLSDLERRPRNRRGRLSHALAGRDWIGIAIEFVVVTAGVLLAFQINQWADRQKRHEQEHEFLERLYRENGEAIDELKHIIPQHHRAMEQMAAGVRARNSPVLLDQLSRKPDFGCLAGVLPSVGFNDTAFEEIVQSGKLDIVSDPQLQSSLRDLVALQAVGAGQLDYARQITIPNMNQLEPVYRYEISSNEKQRPLCTVDWPALARYPRAVNSAVRAYRVQQLMFGVRRRALARSEEVEQKLGCVLHKIRC